MKKKLLSVTLLVTVGLSLGGCVQNAKADFSKQIEAASKTKKNNITVDIGISDIQLSNATSSDPLTGMMMTQFKAIKLSVENIKDSKNKDLMETNIKLDGLGTRIPVKIISSTSKNESKVYLSTDTLSSIIDMVESFSGEKLVSNPDDLKLLKGKYVNLADLVEQTENTKSIKEISKELTVNEKFNQAYDKEVVDYLKQLDNKTFEKKNNVVSHTFTFKEIKEIIDLRDKVIKSNKEFKNIEPSASLKARLKEFSDISVKVAANKKDGSFDMDFTMKPTEQKVKSDGLKSLKLNAKISYKMSDKTIKLPAKDQIISDAEMNQIFSQPDVSTTLTDDEFSQVTSALEEAKKAGPIDEETQKELLTTYKDYLTEDQYKKLEEAMK